MPGGPAGPVLIVVVVNARADSPAAVHEANQAARERLDRELPPPQVLSDAPAVRAYPLPGGTAAPDRPRVTRKFPARGTGGRPRAKDRQRRGARAARRGTPRLALAPQHRRRHAPDPGLLRADGGARPGRTGAARLLLRAPLRGRPGPRARRSALRDLAALLRAGARLGRLALRVREHGKLPGDSGGSYAEGARVSPEERRRGLLRPRQARQGRRDRAPGGNAAVARRAPVGPRAVRHGPRAAGPDGQAERRSPTSASTIPLVFAHLAAWLRPARPLRRRRGRRATARWRSLPAPSPFFRTDLLREALEKLGVADAIARRAPGPPTRPRSGGTSTPGSTPFGPSSSRTPCATAGYPRCPGGRRSPRPPSPGSPARRRRTPETLRRALAAEERALSRDAGGVPALRTGTRSRRRTGPGPRGSRNCR